MAKMTQEQTYIHLLKIHVELGKSEIPNAQAIIQARLAKSDGLARTYLKRMEALGMVRKVERGLYKVVSATRFPKFMKIIAKRVGYPHISYKPVDKSVKPVGNLFISGIKPVEKNVERFMVSVDNLLAKAVFGESYPHPVDKSASYTQGLSG